jgi:hypothetical protein
MVQRAIKLVRRPTTAECRISNTDERSDYANSALKMINILMKNSLQYNNERNPTSRGIAAQYLNGVDGSVANRLIH